MNFSDLGIAPNIAHSLERLSFVEPTPIQAAVLPLALVGSSLVAISQTGSGKTISYLAPLAQRTASGDLSSALVLAPTRELAQQIASVYRSLMGDDASMAVIVGGVEYAPQREALQLNPKVVIATPGRLLDLIGQGVEVAPVDYFVLDEVDQMLDLGFREPIAELAALRKSDAQSLFFSATLPSAAKELLSIIAPNCSRVEFENQKMAVEQIEQLGYYVSRAMMDNLLLHLLRLEQAHRAIIFTRSKAMADRVALLLRDSGFAAEAMHSDRSQSAREHILERFRGGETTLLVATDVVARGVDVDGVTHIFNYGLPLNAEQYIHRIGRTARAGKTGRALSLIEPSEREMQNSICRMMRQHIKIDPSHPYITLDVVKELAEGAKGDKSKRKKR